MSYYKFQHEFKLSWQEALSFGIVYNAMDAMNYLKISKSELNSLWWRSPRVQCNGGLHVGKIKVPDKPHIFVVNGFYPEMRSQYFEAESSIYYFNVAFDDKKLTWLDFRRNILGVDNPKTAGLYTIRGQIYHNWREYGLKTRPDVMDNGVHGSASPFEALIERMHWLDIQPDNDHYVSVFIFYISFYYLY